MGHSTIHGEDHWMRVLYNGRMLARETGANLNVVELFAIIHDCQRDNDDYDLEHEEELLNMFMKYATDGLTLMNEKQSYL